VGLIAPLAGFTVAIVSDDPADRLCALLPEEGARIVGVPTSQVKADQTPLRRLVDLITTRLVDAVVFTSAPAVASLVRAAGGDTAGMLAALRAPVLAGCAGPVIAKPLIRRDVPVLVPAEPGCEGLVRALVTELPRRTVTVPVTGGRLILRGHAAVLEGEFRPLSPAQMAILRALAAAGGKVLPRSELVTALPPGADEHAVEMAVARLRAALGRSGIIQTVVKRGYRLRME
jgi:uroporphyrinogen-III synthase